VTFLTRQVAQLHRLLADYHLDALINFFDHLNS